MKKYKHLNAKEFTSLKALLDAGVKPSQVKTVTGRSNATLWLVSQVQSFDEYTEKVKKTNTKPVSEVSTNGVNYKQPEVATLQLIQIVANIEKQITRLADAWERQPEGKKFFRI